MGPRLQAVALHQPNRRVLRLAKSGRAFGDCIEYGLEVCWRTRYDTEDFASGCLLFQGLAHLRVGLHERPVLFLEFLEQPHVLDGNHGLVGEGLEQSDLLVSEGLDLSASERDRTDSFALAQERNAQSGAVTKLLGGRAAFGKLVHLRLEIRRLNRLPIKNSASGD